MAIVPLDPFTLAALMLAGAVFALAGLWLMFRPQVESHVAVLKFFGMEFQASSAGLLVFIIGAAFLASPLIVPKEVSTGSPPAGGGLDDPLLPLPDGGADPVQQDEKSNWPPLETAEAEGGDVAALEAQPMRDGQLAVMLPAEPGAEEQEPNDRATQANQIPAGIYIAGRTNPERGDLEDWFVVSTEALATEDMVIHIRTRAPSAGTCSFVVLDSQEQIIGEWYFADQGAAVEATVDVGGQEYVFVRIYDYSEYACTYEIKVE